MPGKRRCSKTSITYLGGQHDIIRVGEDIMGLNEFYQNMIQIEENARVFYEELAGFCEDRIKETVITFAKQEEMHKEIIKELFGNIENVNLDLSEKAKEIIKEQEEFIKNNNKNINFGKEKEFFNFAFSIEMKGIDTYSEIIKNFKKNTEEYNLFNNLIEEEKKHMLFILKKLHELK